MPKIRSRTAAFAASLALVVGVSLSVAPAATSADKPLTVQAVEQCRGYLLNAGPKLKAKAGFRTEFVGAIKGGDGRCGICPDYGRLGPDGRWSTGDYSWIKDRVTRVRVQWIANAYWEDRRDSTGKVIMLGAVHSNRTAAAQKAAINRLVSADFPYDWTRSYVKQLRAKDPGVGPLADSMLVHSKTAGSVSLKGGFTAKPLPGDTGAVKVTAKGNGRALAGWPVRWELKGATVTSASAKTGKGGTAVLRFSRNGVGPVSYRASVTSPEWRKAYYSTPTSARRQHLLRGGFDVTTSTEGRYDSTLHASITQDCTTTCDGKPPVTLEAKAAGGPTQWQAVVGKTVVAQLALKAGSKGSTTWTAADGQTVTLRYRVKVGARWTAWRTSQTFEVICPPWPAVTPTKLCDCRGSREVGYKFTAAGPRPTLVRLSIGGQVQERTIRGTETVTLSGPVKAGDRVVASAAVKAGGKTFGAVFDDVTQNR